MFFPGYKGMHAKHNQLWDAGSLLGLGNTNGDRKSSIGCFGMTVKKKNCIITASLVPGPYIRALESMFPAEAAESRTIRELASHVLCGYHKGQANRVAGMWINILLDYAQQQAARTKFRPTAAWRRQDGGVYIKREQRDGCDHPWGGFDDSDTEDADVKSSLEASQQKVSDLGKRNAQLLERLKQAEAGRDRAARELKVLRDELNQKDRKEAEEWAIAGKRYEAAWSCVRATDGPRKEGEIPWPTKLGDLASVNEHNVLEFFEKALPAESKSELKKKWMTQSLRWHPDQSPFAKHRVNLSEGAGEGVDLVVRLVVDLREKLNPSG